MQKVRNNENRQSLRLYAGIMIECKMSIHQVEQASTPRSEQKNAIIHDSQIMAHSTVGTTLVELERFLPHHRIIKKHQKLELAQRARFRGTC